MASESGDMKLLGNLSKLIELIASNADYNPADPTIKLTGLNAQRTALQRAERRVSLVGVISYGPEPRPSSTRRF
jgi:hypothetical protein